MPSVYIESDVSDKVLKRESGLEEINLAVLLPFHRMAQFWRLGVSHIDGAGPSGVKGSVGLSDLDRQQQMTGLVVYRVIRWKHPGAG